MIEAGCKLRHFWPRDGVFYHGSPRHIDSGKIETRMAGTCDPKDPMALRVFAAATQEQALSYCFPSFLSQVSGHLSKVNGKMQLTYSVFLAVPATHTTSDIVEHVGYIYKISAEHYFDGVYNENSTLGSMPFEWTIGKNVPVLGEPEVVPIVDLMTNGKRVENGYQVFTFPEERRQDRPFIDSIRQIGPSTSGLLQLCTSGQIQWQNLICLGPDSVPDAMLAAIGTTRREFTTNFAPLCCRSVLRTMPRHSAPSP